MLRVLRTHWWSDSRRIITSRPTIAASPSSSASASAPASALGRSTIQQLRQVTSQAYQQQQQQNNTKPRQPKEKEPTKSSKVKNSPAAVEHTRESYFALRTKELREVIKVDRRNTSCHLIIPEHLSLNWCLVVLILLVSLLLLQSGLCNSNGEFLYPNTYKNTQSIQVSQHDRHKVEE